MKHDASTREGQWIKLNADCVRPQLGHINNIESINQSSITVRRIKTKLSEISLYLYLNNTEEKNYLRPASITS